MSNHVANCLPSRRIINQPISLVILGLVISGTVGCLKGSKTNSTSSTVNGITTRPGLSTVFRQCEYIKNGERVRSTVFRGPGGNLLQKVLPADPSKGRSKKVVTTQTLNRQASGVPVLAPKDNKGKFTLPTPLTLEVPDDAECATCSFLQKVDPPTTLQVGDEVYLPLGSLDYTVAFDQAYASLRIDSIKVLDRHSPEFSEISRITGAQSPNLLGIDNHSISLIQARFSPIHGDFEVAGQKFSRGLQASEIASLITSSPVFKGMATISTPLGINPESFLGWNMDTKIIGENSIMITIPDFTSRLVTGAARSANNFDTTSMPTSEAKNKEINSKAFFMDFNQPINLVAECRTVNQSSRDPSNLASMLGKETLLARVHMTNKDDLIVYTSKVGVGFERHFSLNLSTGDITYSGIGESKVIKPPTRGGDLVQYVRYLGKMTDYLRFIRDGKGDDQKVYNSRCPDLENAVTYLGKIYAKLKPNYLNKHMISFMNAFDFMEF